MSHNTPEGVYPVLSKVGGVVLGSYRMVVMDCVGVATSSGGIWGTSLRKSGDIMAWVELITIENYLTQYLQRTENQTYPIYMINTIPKRPARRQAHELRCCAGGAEFGMKERRRRAKEQFRRGREGVG